MRALVIILIVIAVIVVLALAAFAVRRRRRRQALQERFGPEYERALDSGKSRGKAEAGLADRAKRRERFEVRPLSPNARRRYEAQWTELQSRFVDRPQPAVADADGLVADVMHERGYPVDDFESQADLVSVDHPRVVENYRTAHSIFVKDAQGEATTEDLRRAVIAYRALFEELLADTTSSADRD
jgi:hypothetical protein